MGLNRSKGNMYNFVDYTFNYIKGECYHNCSYCYMKRWGKQNPLHFNKKELKEFDRDMKKYGENKTIFVGSSCDMFARNVPYDYILEGLEKFRQYNNTYLLQTKDPDNLSRFMHYLPEKSILCVTLETDLYFEKYMGNAPVPIDRVRAIEKILKYFPEKYPIYITIEPIMDFYLNDFITFVRRCNPIQVNIGADTGNNNLPEPSITKVNDLVRKISEFTTVHKKKNLNKLHFKTSKTNNYD